MAVPAAKIATNITGYPEVAANLVRIQKKDKTIVYRRRAVIGWNHTDDSPTGLERGRVWCWVSEGNHFQVYDAPCNRSKIPGQVVYCGVANFTMIRMFHPFWCNLGKIPRDMVSTDKKKCRENYRRLMRRWRTQQGLPEDDEESDDPDPPNDGNASGRGGKPAGRGRGRGRARGGRGGRGGRRVQRRTPEQTVTGQEVLVPGSTADDTMDISEDDCNRDCDSTDSDSDESTDESDNDDHARAKPRLRRAVSKATTTDTGTQEDTPGAEVIKQEEEDPTKVKEEGEEQEAQDREHDADEQEAQEQAAEDDDFEMLVFIDLTNSETEEDEDANFGDETAAATAFANTNDDKDDDAMFFPSVDGENSIEADNGSVMEESDGEIERTQETVAVDPAVKEEERREFAEQERRLVATSRNMQGPREVIVIDD